MACLGHVSCLAFDADGIREFANQKGAWANIPPKRNRREPICFSQGRIDERVRLGDVEMWEASGDMMAHPLHIHGVHLEVLSRNGSKPTIRAQGLRDTDLVREPVELLVHFTQPAVKAPFMYHCHILEHEDNGMMGQFVTS